MDQLQMKKRPPYLMAVIMIIQISKFQLLQYYSEGLKAINFMQVG